MPRTHGLIQKAKLDAERLPWRTFENACFWFVEKWQRDRWVFVCRCETQDEAEDFLVGKLTQEHP